MCKCACRCLRLSALAYLLLSAPARLSRLFITRLLLLFRGLGHFGPFGLGRPFLLLRQALDQICTNGVQLLAEECLGLWGERLAQLSGLEANESAVACMGTYECMYIRMYVRGCVCRRMYVYM